MQLPLIKNKEDLIEITNEIGLLPFFENHITGFSVEENISEECWWQGQTEEGGKIIWPAWEWKGEVLRDKILVYGKFTNGKACFVSLKWWPYLCNIRRNGYDFDSLLDEHAAHIPVCDRLAMEYLHKNGPCLSKEIKYGLTAFDSKGHNSFDGAMTRLQMETYITPVDFVYPISKKTGLPYGWGIAKYDTADGYWGKRACRSRYKEDPQDSYSKLEAHLLKMLPECTDKDIKRLLKSPVTDF